MCGSLAVGLLARPWVRRVAALALVALTIALFILNFRRTAERAGRAAERLDQLEHTNAIHRQMLDAAVRRIVARIRQVAQSPASDAPPEPGDASLGDGPGFGRKRPPECAEHQAAAIPRQTPVPGTLPGQGH